MVVEPFQGASVMDIPLLADAVAQMLAPALPALIQGGQELVADAGKALGTGAWERITGLWGKLRPRVEERPIAEAAVKELAQAPEDPEALEALRLQIKKILKEDEAFAREIAQLVGVSGNSAFLQGDGAIAQGQGAVAAGAGGIAVGRDLHGGVVLGQVPQRRRDRDGDD
jgi:hypothetical protein